MFKDIEKKMNMQDKTPRYSKSSFVVILIFL